MKTQRFRDFTAKESETWKSLFDRQSVKRHEQMHPVFESGIEQLGISGSKIPNLEEVNSRLEKLTGFSGVPVEGLEMGGDFFSALAERKFPIGNFIRSPEDLSYTPAPDVFHDLYGHLPFLANDEYADFCHEFGQRASQYANHPGKLRQFERLFWFGVEFPLIHTSEGRRIFGAGIASSFDECSYSLSDAPEVLPFDPEVIRHLEFRIDVFQTKLFELNSSDQLYSCLEAFEQGLA